MDIQEIIGWFNFGAILESLELDFDFTAIAGIVAAVTELFK